MGCRGTTTPTHCCPPPSGSRWLWYVTHPYLDPERTRIDVIQSFLSLSTGAFWLYGFERASRANPAEFPRKYREWRAWLCFILLGATFTHICKFEIPSVKATIDHVHENPPPPKSLQHDWRMYLGFGITVVLFAMDALFLAADVRVLWETRYTSQQRPAPEVLLDLTPVRAQGRLSSGSLLTITTVPRISLGDPPRHEIHRHRASSLHSTRVLVASTQRTSPQPPSQPAASEGTPTSSRPRASSL